MLKVKNHVSCRVPVRLVVWLAFSEKVLERIENSDGAAEQDEALDVRPAEFVS